MCISLTIFVIPKFINYQPQLFIIMMLHKLMIYVALATIISLILSNAKNFEAKLRYGVPKEQIQLDFIAEINKITVNRFFKSVIDRFEAMQERIFTGAVYDRGKNIYISIAKIIIKEAYVLRSCIY